MMKKFIEHQKHWGKRDFDFLEEKYKISSGCCLFHDLSELTNFTNIDDDILSEY